MPLSYLWSGLYVLVSFWLWVNNHQQKDQLKQFKRETEGRYQYGGKRVKIHEENGELMVTSGRKIMPIDYFVENFD